MARLRATEHHVEGPGDQPRRRGRKSKAVEHGASSPVKRTASQRTVSPPAVEVSAKRVKRVHIEQHVEQHVEEHDEEQAQELVQEHTGEQTPEPVDDDMDELQMPHSQPADTITLATPAEQVRRARRRLSEPLGANDGGLQTPTNSVRQMRHFQSRRARMSMPAQMHQSQPIDVDGVREIQYVPLKQTLDGHLKRRLRRNHLSEEMNDIEDHKKRETRMKKVLADLRKDLESKQKKIKDLEFQLEARRLGDIEMSDDQTADLRQQLSTAQQEIEELRNSSVYTPGADYEGLAPSDDYEDDEALILPDPEELGISQDDLRTTPLPNGDYAIRSLEASQITVEDLSVFEETTQDRAVESSNTSFSPMTDHVGDKVSERSRQRYEAEIEALMHRVADAQGALRCVTIELQNLDIMNPGNSAADILATLRRVLESSRDRYEAIFAKSVANLSNSAFILKLVQELEGMNAELLEKIQISDKLKGRVKLIETHYETSMGLLADETEKSKTLAQGKAELEAVNAEQTLRLEQLNNSLDREAERVKQQEETIAEQNTRIDGLEGKIEEKDTGITRLTSALDTYRADLQKLTDTVQRLEQEHTDKISHLKQEHATAVQDLEERLEAEDRARAQAQDEADQKTGYIEELEAKILELESQVDEMDDSVDALSARLSKEKEDRSAAEATSTEQAALLDRRAQQIDDLNETIENLHAEIAKIKMNLVAERDQRQATEEALSAATEKIEQLNGQVQHHGVQANELRLKLYQLQQERDGAVKDHKEQAMTLKKEYEELVDEKERLVEEGEKRILDLNSKIEELNQELADLQDTLAATESARDAVEVERDELRQTLNRQLEELRSKYAALQSSTTMQIDALTASLTDATNENKELKEHNEALENEAIETTKEHQAEMSEANDHIATLKQEKAATEAENVRLNEKTLSLERRVESEATELLNIMDSHAEESDALRRTIEYQKTHIANLEDSKKEEAENFETELAEKNRQIEELDIISEARGETVLELQAQVEYLKDMFKKQAEDSQATIDALVEKNRIAIEQQEELAAASQKRTEDALKALAEMKTAKIEIRTHSTNLNKVQLSKVNKPSDRAKISKSKKKKTVAGRGMMDRPRDSGYVEFMEEEVVEREVSDEGIVS